MYTHQERLACLGSMQGFLFLVVVREMHRTCSWMRIWLCGLSADVGGGGGLPWTYTLCGWLVICMLVIHGIWWSHPSLLVAMVTYFR